DGMFVDELRMPVAAQKNAEIVEPGDVSLQLHSIDQKNRDGRFALAHGIQERVLQILLSVGHGVTALFLVDPAPLGGEAQHSWICRCCLNFSSPLAIDSSPAERGGGGPRSDGGGNATHPAPSAPSGASHHPRSRCSRGGGKRN